jgi:hypothetical protein
MDDCCINNVANRKLTKRRRSKVRTRRRDQGSPLSFERLESKRLLAAVAPVVVADYQDDFKGEAFPRNWEYLWNAPERWSPGNEGDLQTGSITDHPDTFDPLNWVSEDNSWRADFDSDPNNSPSSYLNLVQSGGHPGRAVEGVDRFAITAFEIQESGFYTIEDSLIGIGNVGSNADGVSHRVFVNDHAPLETGFATENGIQNQSAFSYFDTELGFLAAGDKVYVAVGSHGNDSYDFFNIDYSIVRHESREVGVETFSAGSIADSEWQYTVEHSGLYGIQGSEVTNSEASVSIHVDNNNGITTDDALFSVNGLGGTDSRPGNNSFDLSLGYLRKGDTVTIVGSDGDVVDDFSIVRIVPREAPNVSFADSVKTENVFAAELPHDTMDAFPSLNQTIEQALAHAASLRALGNNETVEVSLEPGLYHLNSANTSSINLAHAENFFLLDNISNFVINGNGATIVTSDYTRGIFRMMGSQNVIIKDLNIDYAELSRYSTGSNAGDDQFVDFYKPVTFTQGMIKEVNASAGSILLEVDTKEFFAPTDGFTRSHGNAGQYWGFAVQPDGSGRLATDTRSYSIYTTESAVFDSVSADDSGDGTLRRFWVSIGNGIDGLAAGDGFVMQRRTGAIAFSMIDTERVSLQRVTAWSAPGLFMISQYSSLNNVLDSHVMIRPDTGRWSSINADAVHVQSDLTGVWVEDSSFYGVSDDVMNFYSNPSTVHENVGGPSNELIIGEFNVNTPSNFAAADLHQPGDVLAFVNPTTGLVIGKARVGSVTFIESYRPAGAINAGPVFRINLDQPISGIVEGTPTSSNTNDPFIEGYGNDTLVFNTSINQGFVVQDSVLANSRRYGNFLMANNVNLVDNVYEGLPEQAIAGHSELAWPLGAHPRNVLVQGNHFRDIGFSSDYLNDPYHQGAVSFFMDRSEDNGTSEERAFVDAFADEIEDIQIRDNVFEEWSKRAIVVRNANRVTIEDNDILGTNSAANIGTPASNLAFELDFNRELAIANNRVPVAGAFQTDYEVGENVFAREPELLEFDEANTLLLEPARVVSVNRGIRDESRPDLLTSFSVTFDRAVDGHLLSSALTLAGMTLDPLQFQYDAALRTATWSNFRVGGDELDAGDYTINVDASSVGAVSPLPIDIHLALAGDIDLDRSVDVLGDAFTLVGNLSTFASDPIVVETTWRMGDINGDNAFDVLGDARRLDSNLGRPA